MKKLIAILISFVLAFALISCDNADDPIREIDPNGGLNPDGSIDTPIVDADDIPGWES